MYKRDKGEQYKWSLGQKKNKVLLWRQNLKVIRGARSKDIWLTALYVNVFKR